MYVTPYDIVYWKHDDDDDDDYYYQKQQQELQITLLLQMQREENERRVRADNDENVVQLGDVAYDPMFQKNQLFSALMEDKRTDVLKDDILMTKTLFNITKDNFEQSVEILIHYLKTHKYNIEYFIGCLTWFSLVRPLQRNLLVTIVQTIITRI